MVAPVLPASIPIEFGAETAEGGGGYPLSLDNTGGTIAGGAAGTSNIFTSGNADNYFQIDAAGIVSLAAAGRSAGAATLLTNGPRTLAVKVYDSSTNFTTANLVITVTPDTQHIGYQTTAGTNKPSPDTQLLGATARTPISGYTSYCFAPTAKFIKYRPGVTIAKINGARMFNDRAKYRTVGVVYPYVTHIGESATNRAIINVVTATSTGNDRAMTLYKNVLENLHLMCPIYRELPEANPSDATKQSIVNVGSATGAGITASSIKNCIFESSDVDVIGFGPAYRSIWITTGDMSAEGGQTISFEGNEWRGLWYRGCSISFTDTQKLGTFIFKNNNVKGVVNDLLHFSNAVGTMVIEDNLIHSNYTDTYNAYLSGVGGATPNCAKLYNAGLTGAADATKALLVFRVSDYDRGGRFIDIGGTTSAPGIEVGVDSVRKLVVNVRSTTGALLGTLTSATPIWNGSHTSIIISLDTNGSFTAAIRRGLNNGGYSWEDISTTSAVAGASIDLTGPVTIGGVKGTSSSNVGFSGIHFFPNKSADTTNATVRDYFFGTHGAITTAKHDVFAAADGSGTYGRPAIDFFGHWFDYWYQGTNLGSGGNFTQLKDGGSGTIGFPHGDLCQFTISGAKKDTGTISIRRNVFSSYGAHYTIENSRYSHKEQQGPFMEDAGTSTGFWYYRDVTVEDNIVASNVNWGTLISNPINCTIRNNTYISDPNQINLDHGNAFIVMMRPHYGTGTSMTGNLIEKNVVCGKASSTSIQSPCVGIVQNNLHGIESRVAEWSDWWVGDGGAWDLSTGPKAKAALARKAGGYLALNDLGADIPVSVSGDPPSFTIDPVSSPGASGAYPGNVITCDGGTTINGGTKTYQWRYGTTNIVGATSSTYTIQSGDVGRDIYCRVTDDSGISPAAVADSNTVTILALPTYFAQDDTVIVPYAGTANINVLANDLNLDNVTAVSGGNAYVSAVIEADKSITVTALPGFTGITTFTVTCKGNSNAVTRTSTLSADVEITKTYTITTS